MILNKKRQILSFIYYEIGILITKGTDGLNFQMRGNKAICVVACTFEQL
jgi:hypothetical protein